MTIENFCKNYFNGVHQIRHHSENDCQTNVLAGFKVASYFFVVPPLFVGLLYGGSAFVNRCCKGHTRVHNIAQNAAVVLPSERDSLLAEKRAKYSEEVEAVDTNMGPFQAERYIEIAKKQIEEGLNKDALKTLDRAFGAAHKSTFEEVKLLCAITELRVKIQPNICPHELSEAEKLLMKQLDKITKEEEYNRAYFLAERVPDLCSLARAYHQAGVQEKAEEWLKKAKELFNADRQSSFVRILERIQKINECEQALGLSESKSLDFYKELNEKLESFEEETIVSHRVTKYCQLAKELIDQSENGLASAVLTTAAQHIRDEHIGLETESYCEIAKIRLMIDPDRLPEELWKADRAEESKREKMSYNEGYHLLPGHVEDLCELAECYHLAKKMDEAQKKLEKAKYCADRNKARTFEYLSNLCKIAKSQIQIGLFEEAKSNLIDVEYQVHELRETKPEVFKYVQVAKLWFSIDTKKSARLLEEAKSRFSKGLQIRFDQYAQMKELSQSILSLHCKLYEAKEPVEKTKFTFNEKELEKLSKDAGIRKLIEWSSQALTSGDIETAKQLSERAEGLFKSYTGKDYSTISDYATAYDDILKAEAELTKLNVS